MLQQTTVPTVLNHFERFLQHYPNMTALAQATEEEICVAWKGLGYYRRARNLLKAAKVIVRMGRMPKEYDKLVQIPGIGDYTASALIAIGRDERALCIDSNIERVTCRLFGIRMERGPKLAREIKLKLNAREIYPDFDRYSYREFNEALMDLGRTICQANRADCTICPMSSQCMSINKPLTFPISKKVEKFFELELIRYVVRKGRRILIYRKEEKDWLSGQYELPTFILRSQDPSLKQYPIWKKGRVRSVIKLNSRITKYKIINHVVVISESEARKHYRGHGKLIYKDFSSKQNFSHITFKILKKLPSRE